MKRCRVRAGREGQTLVLGGNRSSGNAVVPQCDVTRGEEGRVEKERCRQADAREGGKQSRKMPLVIKHLQEEPKNSQYQRGFSRQQG